MGLEVATYISQLVATNPVGATDPKSQGDDHLRLLKSVLQATFPSLSGAVTASHTELNQIDGAFVNLTNGTVGAPGYTFSGDTDSGLYHVSANRLSISTAGADLLLMDASFVASKKVHLFADGTNTAPGIAFDSDSDTGIYRGGANGMEFSAGGSSVLGLSTALVQPRAVVAGTDGAVGAPAFSFVNDTNTGVYRVGADDIAIACGGAQKFRVGSTFAYFNGAQVWADDGSAGTPAYSFANDTNTGMYRNGTDDIIIAAGGQIVFEGILSGTVTVGPGAAGLALGTGGTNWLIGSTTAATANTGASGAPPAQVAGYLSWNINGTARKVPYYAN